MFTSKEVLEKTGISRATLNNYIGWGIVPKPHVLPPAPHDGAAPRIGYFPEDIVERIAEIQRLKGQGWSMARITQHFSGDREVSDATAADVAAAAATSTPNARAGGMPKLSIEQIEHPAYLVNHAFEVVWFNAAARSGELADFAHVAPAAAASGVFQYLLQGRSAHDGESRDRLLRFHLGLARERGAGLLNLSRGLSNEQTATLKSLYEQAELPEFGLVSHVYLTLAGSTPQPVCLYAVQVREGTLFVYVPGSSRAHRELVFEDLVRKRVPMLTQVAVLVTDLEHSARIWSELPPEEYFDLINDIWAIVDPIFTRHHGAQGKHGGEGLVCYFFPQPHSSHTWNALLAAHEIRQAMRQVSKAWQARKGWTTELYLNTGLNEGQEWLGTFQSAGRTEFSVLGDTIKHATRISEFARSGAIWATKNLIGKLTAQERQRLTYGVRRKNSNGQDVLVAAVFSDAESLADPAGAEALREIARLPITEIVDIAEADKRVERAPGSSPA